MTEPEAVAQRYARRAAGDRYSALRPEVWQMLQERQRTMLRLLRRRGINDVSQLQLTEVGCGTGGNLLEFLRLGFPPEHLIGIELVPERHALARHVLPAATQVWLGDAMHAPVAAASQDLVFQSTVFSSLLDDDFQGQLANKMWQWLRPGGAVLWYDFTFNNPHNADVRGVPLRRVRELFPSAQIRAQRVTLAPPLARAACRLHHSLYTFFNALPMLRTHVLAWVEKPR